MTDSLPILIFLAFLVIVLLVHIARLNSRINERAENQFQRWKTSMLDSEKTLLHRETKAELEAWKSDEEMSIRADALNRSDKTHFGKMTEHLVPWMADTPYDPRDMRFVGSPVDFVVFDGLSAGREVTVHFIEVKTGKTPRLTVREERVRDAIQRQRVKYRLLKIDRPTKSNHARAAE